MMSRSWSRSHGDHGFTMLEILIVMFMIATLAGIAFGLFRSQLSTSRDAAAKSDINHVVKVIETYYYNNNEYPPAGTDLTDQYLGFTPTEGVVVEVHVFPSLESGDILEYCVVGSHLANKRIFWYDSKFGEMYFDPGPLPPDGAKSCLGVVPFDPSRPDLESGVTVTSGTASSL